MSANLVLCGEFNVNFLESTPRVLLLESLLASFNPYKTVKFRTRNFSNSLTTTDNMFIDITKFNPLTKPFINGLSDRDAQTIMLSGTECLPNEHPPSFITITDDTSALNFIDMLRHENWEVIFQESDVYKIFNSFHDTYLRIFHSYFPIKKKQIATRLKLWLSTDIKNSCINKRKLFLIYRSSNDPTFRAYHKKYCNILSSTVISAKKKYCDERILNSNNKTKAVWNIVKTVTNNKPSSNKIFNMNINNFSTSNPTTTVNAFNTYFITIAENLITKSLGNKYTIYVDPLSYSHRNIRKLTASFRINYTSSHEINRIIYSLSKIKTLVVTTTFLSEF